MSEKIKLRISPGVAAFVGSGVTDDDKFRGLETASSMPPLDQVTLLFCLTRDANTLVKETARIAFGRLSEECLLACLVVSDLHPSLLDAIVRANYTIPAVVTALLEYPTLSLAAREFLNGVSLVEAVQDVDGIDDHETESCDDLSGLEQLHDEGGTEDTPVDEDEYLSKYQMVQLMGISEKIKMTLTGDKEWRSVLINDNNKLVSGSVIKNPRITDGEIIKILKVGVQNDEIVRLICANKEWVKNCLIRKALVDCPKTPLPLALRFLASLSDKEIAGYAKSKNISSVISTQAKRIILAKKR
jgi:hypothetical protein